MKIIILGSNFAGLDVARLLKNKRKDFDITVIDKNEYFEFHPSIHKIISREKTESELRIDLFKTYLKRDITFVNDEITNIDQTTKEVITKKGKYQYDYIVDCLGTVTNYYKIPGADQFSYSFKVIEDALKIRKWLDENSRNKKELTVAIAGSGLTGIEVLLELVTYAKSVKKLCNIKLVLIEAKENIAPWTNDKTKKFLTELIKEKNIDLETNFLVKEVKQNELISSTDKKLNFDMLIWCTGIKIVPIMESSNLEFDNFGVRCDDYLCSTKNEFIFVCGDALSKKEADGFIVPKTAQYAEHQAKIVVENLISKIEKKPLKKYLSERHTPILIDLGEYGAILMYKKMLIKHPAKLMHKMKNIIEDYWIKSRSNW